MRWLAGVACLACLACLALAAAAIAAPPAPPPAAPGSPRPAAHFSHADHGARGVALDACEACHAVDARGQVTAPAALGHSPCLRAGCHASDFVAVGAKAKQADPAHFARATAFCLGCHDSKDGAPPVPWQKPATTAALRSFQLEREYHVEMNHFEHTQRGDCRSCHVVDAGSFALVAASPGHAECVACHNPQKFPEFTMAKCGLCHDRPARAEFFRGSRPKIDVRACSSEGHAALEARLGHPVSCFRHERAEHRTADGKPLQCAACHYMVGDKTKWAGRHYQSLRDLHIDPIIDNAQDRQHKSCGQSAACHQRDVSSANTHARCELCHAEKSPF